MEPRVRTRTSKVVQRHVVQDGYDEGIEGWEPQRLPTSSRPARPTNTQRTSSDDIIADYENDEQEYATRTPRRASRPAQSTASRRPSPTQTQKTNGGRDMRITTGPAGQVPAQSARRSTTQPQTTKPTLAQRPLRARTYIPQGQEVQEPLLTQQQGRPLGAVVSIAVGIALIALLLLYFLGSGAADLWITHISDPATFGPAHGNVAEFTDHGQVFDAHGINDNGHISIVVIPRDHPDQAKILVGPQNASPSDEIDLEVKDLNSDGHPDLIEHILEDPGLLFIPRAAKSYSWANNGNGQFKVEPY